MITFFKDLIQFIKNVANDPRIPERDKKVLLVLAGLIASPVDLIPDWIPIFGVMDDFMMLALILDYFFGVLDEEILLAHYPWSLKSFIRLKKTSRWVTFITPDSIKRKIWKFEGSPYRGKST